MREQNQCVYRRRKRRDIDLYVKFSIALGSRSYYYYYSCTSCTSRSRVGLIKRYIYYYLGSAGSFHEPIHTYYMY